MRACSKMKTYIRKIEGDTRWHWCTNCPEYPDARYLKVEGRELDLYEGAYGFCSECKKLENKDACNY